MARDTVTPSDPVAVGADLDTGDGGITESGIGILGIWTCPSAGGRHGPEAAASIDGQEILRGAAVTG